MVIFVVCLAINGVGCHNTLVHKSNRKAMNRNWSNQKANPALNLLLLQTNNENI